MEPKFPMGQMKVFMLTLFAMALFASIVLLNNPGRLKIEIFHMFNLEYEG
ncbi:hypothetical protein ACFHWW_26770 [Ensifer sp. P24N7]